MPRYRRLAHRCVLFAAGLLAATTAQATPRVVASILPLHALVSAVMQGAGTPQLLLRGSGSPHSFQLRPSDARTLHDAQLVFWVGPALETPLRRALAPLDEARSVALIDTPGLRLLDYPDSHKHAHDDHGPAALNAAVDPHIWLAPSNAAVLVAEIARRLSIVDPANGALYLDNAADTAARIAELDQQIAAQLSSTPGPYAVLHDAYRYFEDAFGLDRAAVVTLHPGQAPGAAHLRKVRQTLVERQVTCLFAEPQYSARLIDAVSEGLSIRHAVLDPLGANLQPGPRAYEQLLTQIATTLRSCQTQEAP